jgi:putative polyketide hydroxylase
MSTLDLFDGRLTLLTGPCGARWRRATAGPVAAGVPLTTLSVGAPAGGSPALGVLSETADLQAVDGDFARRYRLGDTGAVLVRPDGHVAWRHPGDTADEPAALAAAVARALGRPTASIRPPVTALPDPPGAAARSGRPPEPSRPARRTCRPAA